MLRRFRIDFENDPPYRFVRTLEAATAVEALKALGETRDPVFVGASKVTGIYVLEPDGWRTITVADL